ncbi:MAG: BMP family protein [Bacillota bacterium]
MRKLIRGVALLLAVLMMVSVAGCAGKKVEQPQQPAEQAKPKVKAGIMYAIMNPARAGGWDRADWAGIEYLRKELGWEVTVAEGVPYPQTAATAAGYAEKGYDIVIFPDNGQIEAFKEVPPKYPKTWFVMTSLCDELPNSPRVAAWFPDLYVYGNVVGAIAAKASKTGTIGVIGGVPIPALITMYSGIIEGAKYVRPDAKVLVYWVGDWVDVPKHREVTTLQVQQGADVIFAVSGPGTTGVFEGAEAGGAKVIGYAADWYEDAPKAVLTSVLIDKRQMYRDMAEQFMSGKLEKKMVNCGAEFFKVADFRGSLPADKVKEIEELVGKMQQGEIVIPVKIHEEIAKK